MSNNRLARLAGLVYLILLPTSGLWYGTWQPLVKGDPAAALARIQASRTFFEFTIVVGAAGFVDFLLVGFVLYRLFSPVGKSAASLLLIFVVASAPLALAAVARQVDILSLLDAAPGLPALDGAQLPLQASLALHGFDNLLLVATIFWGVWLFPFGWLMFRCSFTPRTLGVLLMLGGVYYVCTFAGTVFNPDYANTLLGRGVAIVTGIPGLAGELGTSVWLLIMGARERSGRYSPTVAAAQPAASLSDR